MNILINLVIGIIVLVFVVFSISQLGMYYVYLADCLKDFYHFLCQHPVIKWGLIIWFAVSIIMSIIGKIVEFIEEHKA